VDQVTLKSLAATVDNDRWTPACLEVRFDGEPVYCNDAIGAFIGTGSTAGEVASWSDPAGLHQACTTCQGSTLTHGPMLGPPEPDALRVWARTDATRPVALRLSDRADLTDAPVVAWAHPRPEDDFTARFEVRGLRPNTEHFFRVEVEGAPLAEGRARTAPLPSERVPVRLAFGSCTRLDAQPIFARALETRSDLFLFVGDNMYANSRFRDTQRWHYRRFAAVPERAALLASVPTLAGWDDHDFVGNNSTGTCLGRGNALRTFREYWANPPLGSEAAPGAYFSQRFGPVEVFVTDDRTYRPEVGDTGRQCDDDPAAPALSRGDGPLGAAQTEWLLDALAASDADFKLVACGSQWTAFGSLDSWAAFPAARAALFDAIAARGIEGVVLLSGDIHRSTLRHVDRERGYALPEITSSPMANGPSTCASTDTEAQYCYDAGTSFVTLDVDPAEPDPTLTVRVRDDAGAVLREMLVRRSELR
jgi:alkaline phosphatase D